MKKLTDIFNINSFCSENDVIAVVFKKSTVQLLNEYFEIDYEKDLGENLQDIFIDDNFIWTNTAMDGKAVIISNGSITVENFYLTTIKNYFFYISQDGKDKKINESGEVMWEIPDGLFFYKFLCNELCYKKNINELILLDDLNGEKLWNFILLDGKYNWESNGPYPTKYTGEINNIIGAFNNTLWAVLNSGILIGIDVKSGKIEYELIFPNKSDEDFTNSRNVFLYGLHTKLDELRGTLFGLFFHYYWEIDLAHPLDTYVYYDIEETCKQHEIAYNNLKYHCHLGDEVVFAQQEFAQDPSYVGIFNRNTKEITWTSRELGEDGVFKGVKKIDFSDNRLYVFDRANTLHIFER